MNVLDSAGARPTFAISPMNIKEVAKRARVSTATVSRTVNQVGIVRPETSEKVWRVIHALGYQPNTYARALVSGKSHLLGLIISDIANPFFPELVKCFENCALANGMEVIVANTNYDPDRMSLSVRRMLQRNVDGVAVMTSEMEKGLIINMERRRIPMVFLDTGRVRSRISNLRVDYARGIRETVEYLIRLGHRHIAFISGPLELRSARTRRSAFMKWLKYYGLLPNDALIPFGNHKIDGGEKAMEQLLAVPQRPTAVLASNDLTAIGALRAIHAAELKVPEDISLVGFDDIDFSQYTQPALSTIRLSRSQLAEKAMKALLDIIRGKSHRGREYRVETHLIVRGSTGQCATRAEAQA